MFYIRQSIITIFCMMLITIPVYSDNYQELITSDKKTSKYSNIKLFELIKNPWIYTIWKKRIDSHLKVNNQKIVYSTWNLYMTVCKEKEKYLLWSKSCSIRYRPEAIYMSDKNLVIIILIREGVGVPDCQFEFYRFHPAFPGKRFKTNDPIQELNCKINEVTNTQKIALYKWKPLNEKVGNLNSLILLKDRQKEDFLKIIINPNNPNLFSEIIFFNYKTGKISDKHELMPHKRILKGSSSEVLSHDLFEKYFRKNIINSKNLDVIIDNAFKDESVRRSDIAVILLSRLGADIVKKDFDFTGFCRMYSDCVEHLASLPEMTLSADTISEWREKGDLRETEAEIYDFMRGDRYLLSETMLTMAFGLRKLYMEEMIKTGSEKAKEKAGGFISERLSEVLKISGASPMKKLLEDLKAGGPFDNCAKEQCARLLAPVKPLQYEKVENKTKQIDGVPASWLYVSPFKTPKELAERVACLKEIEDEQEASNYAFMLLFALKDKMEWICDGKMSMDGYINTAETLISKINPEKPLTTGLKKHWPPYFKRARRKACRDFITAALLPAYFRMKILAALHKKIADGQNRKDSGEIAKFITEESCNIIKSIPAPPITAMCRMVSQNPFISDEELYPKLK